MVYNFSFITCYSNILWNKRVSKTANVDLSKYESEKNTWGPILFLFFRISVLGPILLPMEISLSSCSYKIMFAAEGTWILVWYQLEN